MSATLINHGNTARNSIGSPTINDHHLKDRIIAEINKIYPTLPNEFRGYQLSRIVKGKIFRREFKFPYDDTVMRYFRQLREDGVIKCECVNKSKSIYKKQP